MDSYLKHEVQELVWLTVYIALTVGIFSLAFGLAGGGFEKEFILQKNMFYIGYGVLFLFGLVALKIAGIFVFGKKHANVEGVTVHDPEQGFFPNWRVIKNPWLLSFLCIIVFGILGWWASKFQTFFSALPNYEQQFTKGADLFFSIYPASPSETLGAIFLISLLGLILGYMVMKGKLNKGWFLAMFLIGGPILSMIYGIVNHILRYSQSDLAMSSVAVFWFFLGLFTVVTGSIIPALLMHDINNFYYKFSTLFGSDVVAVTTFSVLGIMVVLFLIVLLKRRKKKNQKN